MMFYINYNIVHISKRHLQLFASANCQGFSLIGLQSLTLILLTPEHDCQFWLICSVTDGVTQQ